ncbi:MAG: ABC transporter substrate-binding protein [Chloroflexi bacterium]|nr:ABC transporter substrate-binding protein [Chloroflexota bacterium]
MQFETGKLQGLGISADDVIDIKARYPAFQWEGALSAVLYFIFFSPPDRSPEAPWRDERFRQAVSMALDRDLMSDLMYNVRSLAESGLDVSTVWNNIVPAGFGPRLWVDPQSAEQGPSSRFFEHNPTEAGKLLSAVGGGDQPFKYQWTDNRYGPTFALAAEAIHGWMTEAGLAPETETQDSNSVYITQTFRGEFDGVAFGIETPFPEVGGQVTRMFSDNPANHGRVNDPTILDLLDHQATEMNVDERAALIKELQLVHDELMYYVPTQGGAGMSWSAYQPEVRGRRRTRGAASGIEVYAHYWLES